MHEIFCIIDEPLAHKTVLLQVLLHVHFEVEEFLLHSILAQRVVLRIPIYHSIFMLKSGLQMFVSQLYK